MAAAPGTAGGPAPAALLALAAALALALLLPRPLTDGDSALFAALGHQMATGSASDWMAPDWAYQGEIACYHEHPPGAHWPQALLEKAGLDDLRAPVAANLIWLGMLLGALVLLAGARRTDGSPGAGWLAAGIFLLTVPVWKYAGRASLELPFAACVTAAVVAARSPARFAPLLVGAAFGGALLTRGIFGLAVPAILLAELLIGGRRSLHHRARLVAGLMLGAVLAAGYDFAHLAATGHTFWDAYTDKQVLPSLDASGTPHPNTGSTLLYYASRLLAYGLPWWLVAGFALRKRPPGRAARREILAAAAWILVFFAGAAIARRQGSRYLFAVWPALAWGTASSLRPWWDGMSARARTRLATASFALLPAILLAGRLLPGDGSWESSALALRQLRAESVASGTALPAVYGPFAGHDDRLKQLVRHHLGVWALRAPPEGAPPEALELLPAGAALPEGARVWLETERFRLVRRSDREPAPAGG